MTTPETFTPPGYMELWDTALTFLRTMRPGLYRELRRAKQLDDHIDRRITATEAYAATLIEGGESPNVAWHRAVRSEILESAEG